MIMMAGHDDEAKILPTMVGNMEVVHESLQAPMHDFHIFDKNF